MRFARAIVMPNLKPPVTTVALALAYRQRILMRYLVATGAPFQPLMTLYLTDNTRPEEIIQSKQIVNVAAVILPRRCDH
jgi:dihydroorotase